ncbi:isopentenyl-diphosphate Delta-isomerase [Nocardioides zeae]|uniref:Isopentenyl-diphosphate Delta-isomerase n=1 Tax=Nocardioides imazamoxiresistens TaxID=3231893 RepID=A0ABU3PQG3_9ACTN|nr:isopentenyl-diphosphate Delta-isomerase [Nocardioides zeae]MDT9591460.1 isopentenyl-diphosphate Delta-isomerase [Nocardioides zeae]
MTQPAPTPQTATTGDAPDEVVLLAPDGTPCGTAPRATVHDTDTPLHLAFSCWVLGPDGRLLVTRRALSKRTWPGVWTNSFCGHPRPGEPMDDAVTRYAHHELGLRVHDVRRVLPDYRYRAVDASGVVEHEVCPVHLARTDDVPTPHPDEVAELVWTDPRALLRACASTPWAFSPWMVEQARGLRAALLETQVAGGGRPSGA